MHVVSLHLHPVKGCRALDVDRARVQPWGLAGDRRWLVVDEDGSGLTQREVPALTQLRAGPVEGGLVLSATGHEDLAVPEPVGAGLVGIELFAFTGAAPSAGPEAEAWLCALLERKVRLVWLDDPGQRRLRPPLARPSDTVAFQDGFPLSLANLASLDALNDLIAGSQSPEWPLPMSRFRPNVVLGGAPAWIEDEWTGRRIRIGEVVFRVPTPVPRCVVSATDQETGERGHEPLRTLARHRNIGRKLIFATALIPDTLGTIRVGDAVEPCPD